MAKSEYIANVFADLLRRHVKAVVVVIGLLISTVCVLIVMDQITAQRIEHNELAWLEAQIETLIPPEAHDNDLLDDRKIILASDFFGSDAPTTIYRARYKGLPSGAVIRSVTNEGYGGPIELLVAVNYEGEVLGTRILSHHETPNIGNAFEWPGSRWLQQFNGKSNQNTHPKDWGIRKDGGEYQQFASASITPRAIIKAVQRTLDFYQHRRDEIYSP